MEMHSLLICPENHTYLRTTSEMGCGGSGSSSDSDSDSGDDDQHTDKAV